MSEMSDLYGELFSPPITEAMYLHLGVQPKDRTASQQVHSTRKIVRKNGIRKRKGVEGGKKDEMLADREAFWEEFQDAWEEYNDSMEHIWKSYMKY